MTPGFIKHWLRKSAEEARRMDRDADAFAFEKTADLIDEQMAALRKLEKELIGG